MDTALQSSLYSAAAAVCVFSAGLLRSPRTRLARAPAWFTLFLILEALAFVLELLMVHPAAPLKGLWLALRMGLSLLVAPCLWLAVKETADGARPPLASLGRGHFIAIAAGLLLLVPLAENAHLGTTYANPHRAIGLLHSRFIHGAMLGCIAIFAVQVPLFLWRCRRLLLENLRSRQPADRNSPATLAWLQLPLAAVLTTWVLGLLRTVQCAAHAPRELLVLVAFVDVSVTVGALYLILRRVAATPLGPAPAPAIAAPSAPPEPKYRKSALPAAARDRIRRKLSLALADPALACDALLDLRKLSHAIGEKAHYVSQVINQDLGTTFYDLVNRHRIEQAKRHLAADPGRTVLEIALAVGFNSKSTFHAAFRRHAGMTPSAYRSRPAG